MARSYKYVVLSTTALEVPEKQRPVIFPMFLGFFFAAFFLLVISPHASAQYLEDDPDKAFSDVYNHLGIILPSKISRDPSLWLNLEKIKREPCDKRAIRPLADNLERLGYRRQAAEALFSFEEKCSGSNSAIHRAIEIFLDLSDFDRAIEAADHYVRSNNLSSDARYMRARAFDGAKIYNHAIEDYANSIELFNADKKKLGFHVFKYLGEAYFKSGLFCEAGSAIRYWISLDISGRSMLSNRRLFEVYEAKGNCYPDGGTKEVFKLHAKTQSFRVGAEINGKKGSFILDPTASYLTLSAQFAKKAALQSNRSAIVMFSKTGRFSGNLTSVKEVKLRNFTAGSIPAVIMDAESQKLDVDIDGIIGLSFLSRYQISLKQDSLELSAMNFSSPGLGSTNPPFANNAPPQQAPKNSSGSAFRIANGQFVTNFHVINGCNSLQVGGQLGGRVIFSDSSKDLALVGITEDSGEIANLRSTRIQLNEPVTAAGFPLQGAFSGIAITNGSISRLSGLRADPGQLQISAPVQPGNSGGPLLDSAGNVIGVVSSKLNALKMAGVNGDIPQNVNFAINIDQVKSFLKAKRVAYKETNLGPDLTNVQIAKLASAFTVLIECRR